jgi:signal transduction histidine kinase
MKNDIDALFGESEEGFQRIMNINKSLMSFARSENLEKFEEVMINGAIEDTLIVARNEIKYVADVVKELSPLPSIEGNLNQLKQVLLNILVNAAQAIKSEEKDEKGKILIRTYQKKNSVFCEIIDNGPGISSEVIDKIFDPFFTQKKVGTGTGLGLSISYDIIVNKHHGKLKVTSDEGTETCFTIELPTRQPKK